MKNKNKKTGPFQEASEVGIVVQRSEVAALRRPGGPWHARTIILMIERKKRENLTVCKLF